MPENLNWNFNLTDNVGGPAAQMAAALDFFTKKLNVASTGLDGLEKAMQRSTSSTRTAIGGLAEFGLKLSALKELAAPVLEVGGWMFEKAFDFEKKSIEALEFKENTLTSFQVLLGSAKEAQEFFAQAAWLGRSTPFQTKDVVQQFQRLLSAGFTKAEVPVVFQAVGDAAAQRGFSTDVMNNITNALSHAMASGGHNMGRVLQMLQFDAAGTGFQRGRFMEVLAKNLGVTKEGVDGMLASGQIDGRTFVKAFIDHMAETAGGGITGGGMKKMENTFRGIMNTLEGTFGEFFFLKPGSADDVPGFQALKRGLMNLRDALNVTTPAGKHLQDSVLGAFGAMTTSIFGAVSGPDGLKNMTAAIEKIAVVVGNLGGLAGGVFAGMWAGAESFGRALGIIDDTAGSLFDGPLTPAKLDEIKSSMVDFGRQAGEALGVLAASVKDLLGGMLALVKGFGAVVEINTAPTDWDKKQAWGHLFEAFGAKKDMVEGRDFFLPGKNYNGITYDEHGRASMTQTPGAPGGKVYGPPAPPHITVNLNGDHQDPAAVKEAARAGARKGVEEHSDSMRKTAYQAGVN